MIRIYCDGAYSPNTKIGGIGIVVTKDNEIIDEYFDRFDDTTNNRMEILSVIIALKLYPEEKELTIISDSQLVINCAQNLWKKNKNLDLWIEYEKYAKDKTIHYEWVKGHNNDLFNSRADELAVRGKQLI